MAIFPATIPTITDLQNLDVTNLNDNTPVVLRERKQWYYLLKTSSETADETKVITANTGTTSGRWKEINALSTKINTTDNEPSVAPAREGELVFFQTSKRLFIGDDPDNVAGWVELPLKAINYGSDSPTNLGISPRFAGDFFIDVALNRLYISTNGTDWSNIAISDGRTNVFLDNTLLSSVPENRGNVIFDATNEQVYLSTGTSASSDWKILKTNQILFDDTNTSPQTAPVKSNDLMLMLVNSKLFLSQGDNTVDDWFEFKIDSFEVVADDPANAEQGVKKFSYNSTKKQLWISDGTETNIITDIKNKDNYLWLDVENYTDYTNFVDIDGDIGLQIYWHPLNIPYHYYDGTSVQYYSLTQYSKAPWTDTGGTSSNDYRAKYITNSEIQNARTVNSGTGKIDLSSFLMLNGVGNYFFVPTMLDESVSQYFCIGESGNTINLGLEFTNNEFNENAKILDFKYDSAEFNLATPPAQLSTIKGAFSSYDLASSVYMKTLSGGVKFLQLTSFPVNATIQVKPYELLTHYSNFYA